MKTSQNSNHESNLTKTKKRNYHKIVIKNQTWQNSKISHT